MSKADKRFKGGSGEDGTLLFILNAFFSVGRTSLWSGPTYPVFSYDLVEGSPWLGPLRRGLVEWGAEAILLPLEVPDGALFLVRLPERGIFHVEGDGEENRPPKEKDFLGVGSGSA